MNLKGVLVLVLIAGALADYNYPHCVDYNVVIGWSNDQTYTTNPFFFGNWTVVKEAVGLSYVQIEQLREEALAWFKIQFGLPSQTAIFDPVTNITTVPGWGTMASESFNDKCYQLITSSVPIGLPLHRKYTFVEEFTFQTFPSAAGTVVYGGRFGALNSFFGTTPYIQAGDGFSLGFYYIFEDILNYPVFITRVLFKNKFPTRYDMPFRLNEESYLESDCWGNGTSTLRLKFALLPNSQIFTQFDGLWEFPEPLDIYAQYHL